MQEDTAKWRTDGLAEELVNIPIESLDLPARVYRCLKAAGIHTLQQVVQTSYPDLLRIRNFGQRSLNVLRNRLSRRGIKFDPAGKNETKSTDLTALLGLPIEQAGFSDTMIDRLHLAQIDRLGELVTKTPDLLLRFPSLGPRSIQIIRHVLSDLGLQLGMDFVPVDTEGKKWVDRLDYVRGVLLEQLKTPADIYFFAKECGLTKKTLQKFLKNMLLNPYQAARLRALFSGAIDLSQPWNITELESYRRMVQVEGTYRQTQSLQETARLLKMSHEQVRQILKLGATLNLFDYRPRPGG